MAELTPRERLQPSLLDRLTDDEPEKRNESREYRVLNLKALRQSVLRDLGWLLNTAAMEAVVDLEAYPWVRRSTLNYGIPALAGTLISSADIPAIERRVRQAVMDFEPRILPQSLKVGIAASDSMSQTAMTFTIEGDLWAKPLPEHLFIRTDIDLETGSVRVVELTG